MFVKITKDNQDAMDCLAMDRGIRRLVVRLSHADLNPLAHTYFTNMSIPWKNLTDLSLVSSQVSDGIRATINLNHKRIRNLGEYDNTVECLEEMLYEYEYVTKREHSHAPMLAILQGAFEKDLTFSTEDIDISERHERWYMIANYLASQSRRRYSTIVREWGLAPDSLPFLRDPAYNTAAVKFNYGT